MMTCDLFRANLLNTPEDYTRGMRASFVAHHLRCDECRRHVLRTLFEIVSRHGYPPSAETTFLRGVDLKAQDEADPEYREVVDAAKRGR